MIQSAARHPSNSRATKRGGSKDADSVTSVARSVSPASDGLSKLRHLVPAILGAVATTFGGTTYATNLGTYGTTYDIIEPDLRAVFAEEVEKVDGQALNKGIKERVEHFGDNLPANARAVIGRTRTTSYDLTETVSRDVTAPVRQPDGSYRTEVIVKKGTKVNPLRSMQPATALLFVDPRSPRQREFLEKALAYDPATIQPVVVAGDPTDLAKGRDAPVYFAQPWMLERMKITNVPALARAGTGANAGMLVVTYFDANLSETELKAAWTPKLASPTATDAIVRPVKELQAQERAQQQTRKDGHK